MTDLVEELVDFESFSKQVSRAPLPVRRGRVTAVGELVVTARLCGARVGQQCEIRPAGGEPLLAEVASCDGDEARMLCLGEPRGLGGGDEVEVIARCASVPCGEALLGRAVDPLGRPLTGPPLGSACELVPLRPLPATLDRGRVLTQLVTGIAAIDTCCALGEGQRIGVFAEPGGGKSTLLRHLASFADVDVCVTCLVGERVREAREVAQALCDGDCPQRHVLVVATAQEPVLLRLRAASAATAMARWFASRGQRVLLLVDSLTRVARAGREAFSRLGESTNHGGYPASALAILPKLVEAAAVPGPGSLTAVYAVLTEGGEVDPVAQEAKAVLDGHLVLSRRLAQAGLFPPVDVVDSVSRVFEQVCPVPQVTAARKLRRALHRLRINEDLVLMGAYQAGACRDTDFALSHRDAIEKLLYPAPCSATSLEAQRLELARLTAAI
ncbi:MAG: EscN/YscN/HrcN family type III secretion system ATPase [Myxococcota bacterium]|jgi:type III secretion protein N (ATPase)|nr:EscN/YscN/HrcN family type III secretion system ATPase [Myxococcota bacterium]